MKENEFYHLNDICKIFQVSKITVYRWIKTKKIPAYKVGGAYLFKKPDIEKFLEESKV
jgi:excisionase family DNA binding protein